MSEYDLLKMKKKLVNYLDESRFEHTLGVMYMCAALAMVYGEDLNRAQTAGLLHDCAKCIPTKKKLKICEEKKLEVSEFEKTHPFLLHAKIGAYIAEEKYGVHDPGILSAITWHTTGKPDMNLLEKIVYVADYIEPLRYKARDLARIRRLAFEDLDECIFVILKSTLAYLGDSPKDVDITSRLAYDYYKNIHNRRKEPT